MAPEPIVLVGAPGAGKTTVGHALAERLAVGFADVDAVIVDRVGRPIAEIFADEGEDAFRALEEEVTAELLGEAGVTGPVTLVPSSLVKGLEFDSVVLLEPAAIARDGAYGLRALYVALTRAVSSLVVLHDEDLPEQLRDSGA
jgi:broad-specificity NMP kinase